MNAINTSAVEELRKEIAPLHHQYPGQCSVQPASLELDENGVVSAGWDGEIGGGISMYAWSGRTICWSLPDSLTGEAVADFVAREDVAALLARIHDGHSVEWDGSNNVGRLTEGAAEAQQDLEQLIQSNPFSESDFAWVMTAREWAFTEQNIAEVWPDPSETLETVAGRVESDTIYADARVMLTTDMRDAFLDEIEEAYYRERDCLLPHHIAALKEAGRI